MPTLRYAYNVAMGERTFAEDVKQLGYGAGEILHGEGILAITKALLQSAAARVAIPEHGLALIDVLADAKRAAQTQGVYFEIRQRSAAAALFGDSINYPMRGAARGSE